MDKPRELTWTGSGDTILSSEFLRASNWRDENGNPAVPKRGDTLTIPLLPQHLKVMDVKAKYDALPSVID